jgi:hypothetical protein
VKENTVKGVYVENLREHPVYRREEALVMLL